MRGHPAHGQERWSKRAKSQELAGTTRSCHCSSEQRGPEKLGVGGLPLTLAGTTTTTTTTTATATATATATTAAFAEPTSHNAEFALE